MKSDRMKKFILASCVVFAALLFSFLYLINLKKEEADAMKEEDTEAVISISSGDLVLKENKSIYNGYKPDNFLGVYINVFTTVGENERVYNFSDFDLIADWNKDTSPVLNANVQFVSKDRLPKGQPINIPNATIRIRGNPKAAMKSYRVKFMKGTEGYNGQSVYNLDKNLNDPSRIANKLAHDLIIGLDHMAGFRTSFHEVYIKDDSIKEDTKFYSYGLYTHIEQPNKAYLKTHGLDEKGSIYRAENFYFQLTQELKNVDDPDYDKEAFENVLSIREGKDHSKLIKMLKDINDESKDFNEVFHTYFNEDNYLTWLSINILLGNADAMSEGFLLYNPSSYPVFFLLPWSFDGIFGWMHDEGDMPDIYDRLNNVVLHRKYLNDDGNIKKLKDRIKELKEDAFSPDKVKALIQYYKPVLLEMMDQYPDNVLSTIPLNELMAYIGQIDERILINYNEFLRKYDLN